VPVTVAVLAAIAMPMPVAVTVAIAVTGCQCAMVRYLALVMRLSCANSVVLLNCLPLLGIDKKR
jgi:hypothetical protein